MTLTQEDLQAIGALMDSKLSTALEPINNRLDGMATKDDVTAIKSEIADLRESVQTVRTSQIRVELEQLPRFAAALDGHKLNSEKLDDIKKNLEEITPTVQALEILHQTGYAK